MGASGVGTGDDTLQFRWTHVSQLPNIPFVAAGTLVHKHLRGRAAPAAAPAAAWMAGRCDGADLMRQHLALDQNAALALTQSPCEKVPAVVSSALPSHRVKVPGRHTSRIWLALELVGRGQGNFVFPEAVKHVMLQPRQQL